MFLLNVLIIANGKIYYAIVRLREQHNPSYSAVEMPHRAQSLLIDEPENLLSDGMLSSCSAALVHLILPQAVQQESGCQRLYFVVFSRARLLLSRQTKGFRRASPCNSSSKYSSIISLCVPVWSKKSLGE